MDSSVQQGDDELLEELNEGLKEVIDDGELRDDLQEVVPQAGAAGNLRRRRTNRAERAATEAASDAD